MKPNDVILNLYPDSIGSSLGNAVEWLHEPALAGVFSLCYVLPSLFRSDLDRGFSVVAYELDEQMAREADLAHLRGLGMELKLDLVVNHLSARSPQFQDLLDNGAESRYREMFVDWNEFWARRGEPNDDGCVIPEPACLYQMFMRKPGLPVLRVRCGDGSNRFYWNTFYQRVSHRRLNGSDMASLKQIDPSAISLVPVINQAIEQGTDVARTVRDRYPDGAAEVLDYLDQHCVTYEGQIDLDADSPMTWEFYENAISTLTRFGASVIRLDAFAYLHKEAGRTNFLNEPETWDYLDRLRAMAAKYDAVVLPEIHARYKDGTHCKLARQGHMFYDFFLPGLILHAIETGNAAYLKRWIEEVVRCGYRTVTMLGCHDGIPLLDLEGFLATTSIEQLVSLVVERGGRIKNIFSAAGRRISYYQVNATYFSALGEDTRKLLLARALHIFSPGTPQVWYLDLFAGVNDNRAADLRGHKEINRSGLDPDVARERLAERVVSEQLDLIRLRRTHPAFGEGARLQVSDAADGTVSIVWTNGVHKVELAADLAAVTYSIRMTPGEAADEQADRLRR